MTVEGRLSEGGNPAVASGVVVVAGSASLIRSVCEGTARKIANAHGAVLPLVPTLCKVTGFQKFQGCVVTGGVSLQD